MNEVIEVIIVCHCIVVSGVCSTWGDWYAATFSRRLLCKLPPCMKEGYCDKSGSV
jgi:hypothetical protein